MNSWSAYPTDLPETGEPLIDFVLALADAGEATARRLYDAPGWVAHHNSDAWLFSNPVGAGHGDARWTAWPLAGAWFARNLWESVAFGESTAERIWPAVRGAAEFALAWHHRDGTGAWSTAPATSPENAYLIDGRAVAVDATTAMDQSLLHDLFGITEALATRLGLEDDPVVVAARERRVLLDAEPRIGSLGTVIEWAAEHPEEDPHHRHVSPLYGLYPGPGLWSHPAREAAAATLHRRGDDSSGWSLVWKLALWARLGRGDKVSDLLRLMFRAAGESDAPWRGGLYPNLFAAHPPFQIDANLGFPGVLAEALLQSQDGIHLLPALPAELATGSATGLVARPGIRVDLQWRDGRLERAALRARTPSAEGDVVIRYRGAQLVRTVTMHEASEIAATDFEGVGSSR